MTHRPAIAVLSALILVAGCSSASASPASTPSTPPSAASASAQTRGSTVAPAASPAHTIKPIATLAAKPSSTPVASRVPGDALVGSAAVTVVDAVRVRSKPRVSDDSFKEEPLLPRGTALYVLDGPVSASGYDWYNVAPLSSRSLPSGWVASAGRDGEPWIAAGDFDCPPVPTDFRSLAALPEGVALACFPRLPVTVQARLIWCACNVDGDWHTPWWFHLSNNPELLVEPGVTRVPPDMADWFGLNLDPAGQQPEVLPVGEVVEVTGVFDHPAAASCTLTEMGGEQVPSMGCRLEFAVTRLDAVRP